MMSQEQGLRALSAGTCRDTRSRKENMAWRPVTILIVLAFVTRLAAGEVSEQQWKIGWAKATTALENGFTEDGKMTLVRNLVWPNHIPENQPAVWAKQKKIIGLSQSAVIEQFGKPLDELPNTDGDYFMVFPNGVFLLHFEEKSQSYRVIGWAPRSRNFEKYLTQGGC